MGEEGKKAEEGRDCACIAWLRRICVPSSDTRHRGSASRYDNQILPGKKTNATASLMKFFPAVSEPQEDAPAIGAADGGHANQVLVRLASVHITPPSSGPGFCARAAKRRHEGPAPGSPVAVPGALVGAPTPLALGELREDETEQEQPAPPPPPPPAFFGDRVIWDLGCMETTLGQLTCPKCSDAHLLFSRDAAGNLLDQQQGLRHKYKLVCDCAECDFALDMETSRVMQTGKTGRPPAEVNVAAVAAAEMTGLRQKALDLMFVAMGVRGIHNRRTYTRHSRSVQDAMVQLGHAQILENRRIVRAFLKEQGVEEDEHKRIPVTVSADGNWPVRGACSACGHGCLIFRDDMLQGGKSFVIAQGFRHKHCAVCSYYNSNEHAQLLEPPQHACKKDWDDTSKAMETDILINLVGEVGQYYDKAREGGAVVPRDETTLLRVEYVVCDEDSSFMVRIMDQLPEDLRPGKLSDVNHLSNNFFKALVAIKTSSDFKNSRVLTKIEVWHLSRYWRTIVRQNPKDPQRAHEQMMNLEAHVFGDHSRCHLYPTKVIPSTPSLSFAKCLIPDPCFNFRTQRESYISGAPMRVVHLMSPSESSSRKSPRFPEWTPRTRRSA